MRDEVGFLHAEKHEPFLFDSIKCRGHDQS